MSSQRPPAHVLCIDDDEVARESSEVLLTRWGFRVSLAASGEAGLAAVESDPPDLILVDLQMPGIDGLEVLERVREDHPSIICIMITGHATLQTAVEAMKQGAYDFLAKPFSPDELKLTVARGLERRQLILETEELKAEKALMQANFMTLVSHQMRSPLAAVRQLLEVPASQTLGPVPEAYQGFIQRAVVRLDLLARTLNAWLAMSRLDQDGIDSRKGSGNLGELIRHLEQRAEADVAAAGQTLKIEVGDPDTQVTVDQESILEALYNLVSNAVKYNQPQGVVTVQGRTQGNMAIIAISDQGPGVPAREADYIFDEFYRSRRQEIKAKPGTGLGLAIARKVARAHGGDITVESEPGQGATFLVSLPC
ncbi:MAG: response regulator [Desulfarculaceae bacterium]|nr:response regulator [Desulfarculaceae bacterium]MCF8073392.1 response regulator [Desulfarculaceae bacterium]MCF8103498.1 response regulator [Desulfarculaceae bacterium]MCF8115803.1 response regulator [Desulfarculaceae bacterium]